MGYNTCPSERFSKGHHGIPEESLSQRASEVGQFGSGYSVRRYGFRWLRRPIIQHSFCDPRLHSINGRSARRNLHPGKSLLRPLFWKLPWCPRIRRSKPRLSAAVSGKHEYSSRRQIIALSPGHQYDQCGMHARHHPRLGFSTSELGQWRHGRIRHFAPCKQCE